MNSDKKQLIESLKSAIDESESNSKTNETLESIDKEMASQAGSLKTIGGLIQKQLDLQSETNRDKSRSDALRAKKKGSGDSGLSARELGAKAVDDAMSLPFIITKNFLPALAAVATAFAGIRGWELRALKAIEKLRVAFVNRLPSVSSIIPTKIENWLKGIGKSIGDTLNKVKARITSPRLISGAFSVIGKVVNPIVNAFKSVGQFLAGAGSRLLQPFVTFAKGFATVFKKILLPIGILMSSFAGLKEAMSTEGGMLKKISAFASGFVGDFVGSIFDLVKDLTGWFAGLLGFDGFAEALSGFSFQETIIDSLNAVFDWIGLLFADPVQALTDLFAGMKSVADMVWGAFSTAMTWVGDKLFGEESFLGGILASYNKFLVERGVTSIGGLFGKYLLDGVSGFVSLISNLAEGITESYNKFLTERGVISIGGLFGKYLLDGIESFTSKLSNLKEGITESYNKFLTERGVTSLAALIFKPITDALAWIVGIIPTKEQLTDYVLGSLPPKVRSWIVGGADTAADTSAADAATRLRALMTDEDKAMGVNWARPRANNSAAAAPMPPSQKRVDTLYESFRSKQTNVEKDRADLMSYLAAVASQSAGGSTTIGGSTSTTNVTNVYQGAASDVLNAGAR